MDERLLARVRVAFRLLRMQESGPQPRIFEEMQISLDEQIFAYLAAAKIAAPAAYHRICDEYSLVITSLRRGELERSPDDSSLRDFAGQLRDELQWAIQAAEEE